MDEPQDAASADAYVEAVVDLQGDATGDVDDVAGKPSRRCFGCGSVDGPASERAV
jgi:hypothetical protein